MITSSLHSTQLLSILQLNVQMSQLSQNSQNLQTNLNANMWELKQSSTKRITVPHNHYWYMGTMGLHSPFMQQNPYNQTCHHLHQLMSFSPPPLHNITNHLEQNQWCWTSSTSRSLQPLYLTGTTSQEVVADLEWHGVDEDVGMEIEHVTTHIEDIVEFQVLECHTVITPTHSSNATTSAIASVVDTIQIMKAPTVLGMCIDLITIFLYPEPMHTASLVQAFVEHIKQW